MEISTFVSSLLVLLLVIVYLVSKYIKTKEILKEVEIDLQEYRIAAKEDAKTITKLKKIGWKYPLFQNKKLL